jgi:ProP effector
VDVDLSKRVLFIMSIDSSVENHGVADEMSPLARSEQIVEPRSILKQLQSESAVFRDCKPLALKIESDVLERFPAFDRKSLRVALRMHTASTRYLKMIERSVERFDLDGNPRGEVTDEQRAYANGKLKERFAALGQQQRAQKKAKEAEDRRKDKLQELVNRFGK